MTKIQLAPNVTPKAKYSENFKRVIEKKLIDIASEDKLFERSFLKENKNIEGCINYILSTVHKSGVQGFTDDEVFGMAMHYYDEDDLQAATAPECKVIVNHTVELTEEEKSGQRQKALDELYRRQLSQIGRKSEPSVKAVNDKSQTSLFV